MEKCFMKIQKIASGISQLFIAMDKGFVRVEPDVELLKKFRTICFEATRKLESSHASLQKHQLFFSLVDSNPAGVPDKISRIKLIRDLNTLRGNIHESIQMISSYIEIYEEQWKKSFSVNALFKFRSLLEKELWLLEQEVNTLRMKLIMLDRRDQQLEYFENLEV